MTSSELVSQISSKTFCICNTDSLSQQTGNNPTKKITGNEPEFGAFAKHVYLLSEQYSPEWDKCKLGISVKSLFCQITIGNPSPIVWRRISESANVWEFKAAAQSDKFIFSCREKTPKTALAVNTSSSETFSQNNLELEWIQPYISVLGSIHWNIFSK